MAESPHTFAETLGILRAADPLLGRLGDETAQDGFLRDLISSRDVSNIGDDVLANLIAELQEKIRSLDVAHGAPKSADPEPVISGTTEFSYSGSDVLRNASEELVASGEASDQAQGDGEQHVEAQVSSQQARSASVCTSTDLKRKAEEVPGSAEKKQKLESTAEPQEVQMPRPEEQKTKPHPIVAQLDGRVVESAEEEQKLESTPDFQIEQRAELMKEVQKVDANIVESERESTQSTESAKQHGATETDLVLVRGSVTSETIRSDITGDRSATNAGALSKSTPPGFDSPKQLGEASKQNAKKQGADTATGKAQAKDPKPKKASDDSDEDYNPESGSDSGQRKKSSKSTSISREAATTKKSHKIRLAGTRKPTQSNEEAHPREDGIPQESARPQEVAGPQDNTIEQREQWAIESGLQNLPKSLPTRKPANPSEMAMACNKVQVEKQMDAIEGHLWTAMLACFQENHIELKAPAKLVGKPESELGELYEAQLGPRWQSRISQLATRKPPVVLSQEYTFMGLLGTAVYTTVFKVALPWDAATEVGCNEKYLEQVLNDLGHNLADVVKAIKAKQVADIGFRQNKVMPLATKLAGSLEMVLFPHIKRMTKAKKTKNAPAVEYAPWFTYLDKAFKAAIILKQNLKSSKLDKFNLFWPPADTQQLDSKNRHKPIFVLRNGAEMDVIHSVLPGIRKIVPGGEDVFVSRALVVPGPQELT